MRQEVKEALLEIVQEMEERAGVGVAGCAVPITQRELESYAKQLRRVIKAAGDAPIQGVLPQAQGVATLLAPQAQHAMEIERARQEFRVSKGGTLEESHEGSMVQVMGGPAAPDVHVPVYHPVDPQMPVDAYCELAGAIYQLHRNAQGERFLIYDEAQTARRRSQA